MAKPHDTLPVADTSTINLYNSDKHAASHLLLHTEHQSRQASDEAERAQERGKGLVNEASNRASGIVHDLQDKVKHTIQTALFLGNITDL